MGLSLGPDPAAAFEVVAIPTAPGELRFEAIPPNGPQARLRVVGDPGRPTSLELTVHHALTDGVGQLALARAVVERAAGLSGELPDKKPRRLRDVLRDRMGLWERARLYLEAPRAFTGLGSGSKLPVGHLLARENLFPDYAMSVRQAHFTSQELEKLRSFARDHGVRLNDVLLWSALRQASFRKEKAAPAGRVRLKWRVLMPINLRARLGLPASALQNWVSILQVEAHPGASVEELAAAVQAKKEREALRSLIVTAFFGSWVGRFAGEGFRRLLARHDGGNGGFDYSFLWSSIRLGEEWGALQQVLSVRFAPGVPKKPGAGWTLVEGPRGMDLTFVALARNFPEDEVTPFFEAWLAAVRSLA